MCSPLDLSLRIADQEEATALTSLIEDSHEKQQSAEDKPPPAVNLFQKEGFLSNGLLVWPEF